MPCYKTCSSTNIEGTGTITFTVYTGRIQSQQASTLHLNLGICRVFSQKLSVGHINPIWTACHQRINSPKPVVCSIPQDAGVHHSKPMYQLERQIATSSSSSSFKGRGFFTDLGSTPLARVHSCSLARLWCLMQRSRKSSRQLSFAPFFVKLTPLAFSISASFSAFFFSNSACLPFSSCAFRNNLIKFSRVVVTAIVKPPPITS